jgi:hypothetical protein
MAQNVDIKNEKSQPSIHLTLKITLVPNKKFYSQDNCSSSSNTSTAGAIKELARASSNIKVHGSSSSSNYTVTSYKHCHQHSPPMICEMLYASFE